MTNQVLRLGPFRAYWDALQPKRARKRLSLAVAASIGLHTLIILLTFGAAGWGVPGLALKWPDRRAQAPNLDVRIVQLPPPAPPVEPLKLRADTSLTLRPPTVALAPPPVSIPQRESRKPAPAAKAKARERKVKPKPQPTILAQSEPQEETFKVPPPKLTEPEPPRAPQVAAKKQAQDPPPVADAEQERRKAEEAARIAEEKARTEELARQQAREKEEEARKLAEARKLDEQRKLEEARKAEEARRLAELKKEEEAKKLAELERQEELRKEEEARRLAELKKQEELKKAEEARKLAELQKQEELRKQEEAKRLALEAEALRRAEELARQAAARQKELEAKRLAELEAKRVAEEGAKRAQEAAARAKADADAAAQRERDRLAGQKPAAPTPGAPSGKELAARALEQLRTPGKREELLRPPGTPPPIENMRRRAIVGVERDVLLRSYVDSWRWKIERNGSLNYRRSAGWRVYDPPVVTVSIRSDGTLEQVWIHRSSGVREIDEAVRRIAQLHAPYSAFPPAMARQYDVVDIRRVWVFEDTLTIRDEM